MKGKVIKVLLILFLIIILTASVLYIVLSPKNESSNKADIVQDGTVIMTIDLNKEKNRTLRIDGDNDNYNIIKIDNGTICVSEASCPDKVCISKGTLRSDNLPIVCLPNKLIIRFSEE